MYFSIKNYLKSNHCEEKYKLLLLLLLLLFSLPLYPIGIDWSQHEEFAGEKSKLNHIGSCKEF
jgi:hypothetical protein